LEIAPQLPAGWSRAKVAREFRGAHFEVTMERDTTAKAMRVSVDGSELSSPVIENPEAGRRYDVRVILPG
jgi:cellobionic acid phosphorylase